MNYSSDNISIILQSGSNIPMVLAYLSRRLIFTQRNAITMEIYYNITAPTSMLMHPYKAWNLTKTILTAPDS